MLRTVMRSQTSGKESIAVGNLDGVFLGNSCHGQRSRHTLAPNFNISPGVAHYRSLSCGSTAGVNTHNLGLRLCEHAEGIGFPQIILRGKRQLVQVLNATDIPRLQADLLHFFTIMFHIVIDHIHGLYQPFAL